jgi:hypothetical protein
MDRNNRRTKAIYYLVAFVMLSASARGHQRGPKENRGTR